MYADARSQMNAFAASQPLPHMMYGVYNSSNGNFYTMYPTAAQQQQQQQQQIAQQGQRHPQPQTPGEQQMQAVQQQQQQLPPHSIYVTNEQGMFMTSEPQGGDIAAASALVPMPMQMASPAPLLMESPYPRPVLPGSQAKPMPYTQNPAMGSAVSSPTQQMVPPSQPPQQQQPQQQQTPQDYYYNNQMNEMDSYEVHDNILKAPILVQPNIVIPTVGSERLFANPPFAAAAAATERGHRRSALRVCEAFHENRCLAGDRCVDIHVNPDYLERTRQSMSSWLASKEVEFYRTLDENPQKTFRVFVVDFKEIVEVPIAYLSFTKGLYVDPCTRARRIRGFIHPNRGNGAGLHFTSVAGQAPTNCGLYSANPNQCKWKRWCNQIHINPEWLNAKRNEFTAWFNELERRFQAYEFDHIFHVHDPQLRAIIPLPKFAISNLTRGLFQGSAKKLPSVCMLFQRNRCTAGSCCNQVHIDSFYLNLLRQKWSCSHNPSVTDEQRRAIEQEMAEQRARLLGQSGLSPLATNREESYANEYNEADSRTSLAYNSLGAQGYAQNTTLFEHIPVDENPVNQAELHEAANEESTRQDELSHVNPPGSTTAALMAGIEGGSFSESMLGANNSTTWQLNADGTYSNNPYGSVTSMPEGQRAVGNAAGLLQSETRQSGILPSPNVTAAMSFAVGGAAGGAGGKPRAIRLMAHLSTTDEDYITAQQQQQQQHSNNNSVNGVAAATSAANATSAGRQGGGGAAEQAIGYGGADTDTANVATANKQTSPAIEAEAGQVTGGAQAESRTHDDQPPQQQQCTTGLRSPTPTATQEGGASDEAGKMNNNNNTNNDATNTTTGLPETEVSLNFTTSQLLSNAGASRQPQSSQSAHPQEDERAMFNGLQMPASASHFDASTTSNLANSHTRQDSAMAQANQSRGEASATMVSGTTGKSPIVAARSATSELFLDTSLNSLGGNGSGTSRSVPQRQSGLSRSKR